MKKYLLFVPLLLILACKHTAVSKYAGYTTNNGKDYFKYTDLGTGHKTAHSGDVMEVQIKYAKMNDSVFWDSRDIGFPNAVFLPYDTLKSGGSYQRILLNGNEGDSITFIVPAEDVFKNILHFSLPYFLHKDDMMKVSTRIVSIMNADQYARKEAEIYRYRKDMDMQEQLNLLHYITVNNIPADAKQNNIYFMTEKHGTGLEVKNRSLISIAYTGHFLNGHLFDSVGVSSPLQFRIGDTAQVISGLAIGIKKMREGGKAKIIIPSQLAFGENGSSTGIVPPYTSVIYEVTMLKVTDPGK